MKPCHVKLITISDKIYIKKEDVEDSEHLISLFSYPSKEEELSSIEETETHYLIPSNGYFKLTWDSVIDNRNFSILDKPLTFKGTLREEQQEAVDKFFKKKRARSGILQAACGFGKTYSACSLIARNNTSTLILVHTKLLFRQWIDELEKQIPGIPIGKIGDGLFDVQEVTVGIYKSVLNNVDDLRNSFSTILTDECHLCPADMFSLCINNLNAKVKIGMSATPRRKDGKHVYLPDYFSPFTVQAKDSRTMETPSVLIKRTDFKFNVINPKRDWARQINKLCGTKKYIEIIANMANSHIKQGRRPLILGERVQMLKDLQALIPNSACMIGSTKEEERVDILEGLGPKYNAIMSTKLFDEGISCHRLDTLYITCPSNNPIKLEQRIGRIIREHPDSFNPLVVDFWLSGMIAARQQQARLLWYKQRGYNVL